MLQDISTIMPLLKLPADVGPRRRQQGIPFPAFCFSKERFMLWKNEFLTLPRLTLLNE